MKTLTAFEFLFHTQQLWTTPFKLVSFFFFFQRLNLKSQLHWVSCSCTAALDHAPQACNVFFFFFQSISWVKLQACDCNNNTSTLPWLLLAMILYWSSTLIPVIGVIGSISFFIKQNMITNMVLHKRTSVKSLCYCILITKNQGLPGNMWYDCWWWVGNQV